MKDIKEYETHDFYIACMLHATKRLTLIKLKRQNSKFVTFVFDDPASLAQQLIRSHWDRSNLIPTRDMIEAINELKTRIYNGV